MINKTMLREFRNDLQAAMKAVEAKHGITTNVGNISFDDDGFTYKTTVVKKLARGSKSEVQAQFENVCSNYGFDKADYRRTTNIDGQMFYLAGFKIGARKNVCKIESVNGTSKYVCSASVVKMGF